MNPEFCRQKCPGYRDCYVLEPIDRRGRTIVITKFTKYRFLSCIHFSCNDGVAAASKALVAVKTGQIIPFDLEVIDSGETRTAQVVNFGTGQKPYGRVVEISSGTLFSQRQEDRQYHRSPSRNPVTLP